MELTNMMPELEFNFRQSGKYWIAECLTLDLATQGETFERAQENMLEAIDAFLESCVARGTLFTALRELGLTKAQISCLADSTGARPLRTSRRQRPEWHA